MKVLYIILVSLPLFNCSNSNKHEALEKICFDSGFHQKVNKVSFDKKGEIKKFDGKFVEVEGVFYYSFENVALYPSSSSDLSEALWVYLTLHELVPDSIIRKFDDRKVVMIGRVNLAKQGHLNGYMAALDSVFCIKQIR